MKLDLLKEAVTLYKGPFPPASYSDWASNIRESLERQFVRAAVGAATAAAKGGDLDLAVSLLERIVEADPFNEAATLDLMSYLAQAGRSAATVRVYREYQRLLMESGTQPGERLQAVYRSIVSTA